MSFPSFGEGGTIVKSGAIYAGALVPTGRSAHANSASVRANPAAVNGPLIGWLLIAPDGGSGLTIFEVDARSSPVRQIMDVASGPATSVAGAVREANIAALRNRRVVVERSRCGLRLRAWWNPPHKERADRSSVNLDGLRIEIATSKTECLGGRWALHPHHHLRPAPRRAGRSIDELGAWGGGARAGSYRGRWERGRRTPVEHVDTLKRSACRRIIHGRRSLNRSSPRPDLRSRWHPNLIMVNKPIAATAVSPGRLQSSRVRIPALVAPSPSPLRVKALTC